jgi:hypothetical protein
VRLTLAALAAVFALIGAAGGAAAYPEFQLSTGNARCGLCHISPVGGGLINAYGRGEAADTISQFGGDGSFLYGAYDEPRWIRLGVDLRGMALVHDQRDEVEAVAFPMQGDTYAALSLGDFTLYGTIGPRAQVRKAESVFDRIGAREYWVMWRPDTTGWYARVGRFLAPFGLRPVDHTRYVRRYQGLYTWEETYSASVGRVEDAWEAHLTAFVPIPGRLQGFGPRDTGATALYERRLGDGATTTVGAEARVGVGPERTRYTVGGVGKHWLERFHVLLMGELDLALEDFDAGGSPSRPQLVSYLGATWFPHTGFAVTGAFERFDRDVAVRALWQDAYSVALQYFPLAHWEILLEGKVELPGTYGRSQPLAFLQLHYYL